MGKKIINGTPWHIGTLRKDASDNRRHCFRCQFYIKSTKECRRRNGSCIGSTHCLEYVENTPGDKYKKVNFSKQNKITMSANFKGITEIPMNKINVPDKFLKHTPDREKIKQLVDYFSEYNRLDKPIIVEYINGKYMLRDRYLRYFVANKLGLHTIPAEISDKKNIEKFKIEDKIRQKGTVVYHKKYKKGIVIDSNIYYVTVKFDSGEERKFDIFKILEMDIMNPL